MDILIEICVGTVQDALTASRLGADRLELNTCLEIGGITPSRSMVTAVRKKTETPLVVMNRPRGGGFVYEVDELAVMLADAEWLAHDEMNGMAVGCLDTQGAIDRPAIAELRRRFPDGELVFHRAFDLIPDPIQALEQLIDLDVDRILTSGSQATANQGIDRIRQLVEAADDRIEILPASGIDADNVKHLIEQTGCDQVHATASSLTREPGSDALASANLSFVDGRILDESLRRRLDEDRLARLIAATGR